MALSEKAPPILRQISVRAVMEVLLYQGPRSRAELAKDTKLSKQTMSEVIRAVQEEGWVREKGVTSGHVGRAAILYEVDPSAGYVLGMDIGATSFRLTLVDITGQTLGEAEHPALTTNGPELIDGLAALAETLILHSKVDRERLLFCVLATPGVVDPETGRLTMAPNLPALMDLDLATEMRARLNCDVEIENDVNAAVLGECWTGAAQAANTVAYIAIGSGVGLGITIEGDLIRGATGAAGEVGYLPIGAPPRDPESLERGSLERALGLKGLLNAYAKKGGRQSPRTADDFLSLIASGDDAALATLKDMGGIGALLVLSVQSMFDPSIILLGGVLGREAPVIEAIRAQLPAVTSRKIHLEPSALKSRATLVGASAIALRRLHGSLFVPEFAPAPRRLPPRPGLARADG